MSRSPSAPMSPAQQHSGVPSTARAAPAPQPARSMMLDLYRGAVWGDFDQDLGVAGAAAQSTIGFIPVAGTLAALRDLFACLGQRDPLGVILNLLAIFPVLGGFAKLPMRYICCIATIARPNAVDSGSYKVPSTHPR